MVHCFSKKWVFIVSMLGWLLRIGWPIMAQTPRADSIQRILARQTLSDSVRVHLLIELAWEINENEPRHAAQYLQQALQRSQQIAYTKGTADAWNGLGVVAEVEDSFRVALEHYRRALHLRSQLGDQRGVASLYNNMGTAYENLALYDSALIVMRHNLRIVENLGDTTRIARAHFNLAGVYEAEGDYIEADKHLHIAREVLEGGRDLDAIAKAYTLLGHIRFEVDEFGEARQWYTRALSLRRRLDDPLRLADALSDLGNTLDELGNANNQPDTIRAGIQHYLDAIELCRREGDDYRLGALYNNLGDAYKHLKQYDRALHYLEQARAIRQPAEDWQGLMEVFNGFGDVLERQGRIREALEYVEKYYEYALQTGNQKYEQKAYKDFAKLYAALGEYAKAYDYQVRYDEIRYRRIDEARARSFARKEVLYADEQMRKSLEEERHRSALHEVELAKAATQRKALLGGALALMLVIGLLINRSRLRAKTNRELATKNAQIEQERQRADELLTNILPAATAAELKAHNTVRPVRYDSVTVLFTDFKSFTKIAETVPPEALIGELDESFRLFDAIVERHGLEKIKTIGDSYMCAGGLPLANDTHPIDAVQAAIDMHRELKALMARKRAEGKPMFEMRIGIHTGPVVAGVVGSHKFAYDIWGDTVNTAARLEQGSEEGRINISGTTYERVKHLYHCTFRGELPAKNKGTIAMYFVEF